MICSSKNSTSGIVVTIGVITSLFMITWNNPPKAIIQFLYRPRNHMTLELGYDIHLSSFRNMVLLLLLCVLLLLPLLAPPLSPPQFYELGFVLFLKTNCSLGQWANMRLLPVLTMSVPTLHSGMGKIATGSVHNPAAHWDRFRPKSMCHLASVKL